MGRMEASKGMVCRAISPAGFSRSKGAWYYWNEMGVSRCLQGCRAPSMGRLRAIHLRAHAWPHFRPGSCANRDKEVIWQRICSPAVTADEWGRVCRRRVTPRVIWGRQSRCEFSLDSGSRGWVGRTGCPCYVMAAELKPSGPAPSHAQKGGSMHAVAD